ncbi:hypothetical protein [Streptomyces sp. NPDC002889]|uniref:hypothetical protein n=1 Tax=Streptomyces sp. NPDC002889 TaxID=3364669 RepID=UPI0036A09B7C
MRTHEYEQFRDREERDFSGDERDVWREARAVLRQADVIHLERRWTEQERARAEQMSAVEPRLARAVAGDDRFGIAEILAAGPELAQAWRHAWAPGQHPRGAALVAAAVDARRAGYHRPLPARILQELHTHYLAQRGGPELRPESLHQAWSWATAPTVPAGANSLLIGDDDRGYLAFDYLIDLPGQPPIPEVLWLAILDHAPLCDAYDIARNAYGEGHFGERFLAILVRAAQEGIGDSETLLWDLGIQPRPPEVALLDHERRLTALREILGEDDEQYLIAQHDVGICTMHCGRHEEALRIFEDVVCRGTSIRGCDDLLVLAGRFCAGLCVFGRDAQEGMALLESTLQDSVRVLGARHPATLWRRRKVAELLFDMGDTSGAWERVAPLQDDCAILPHDHPVAIMVRSLVQRF